MRIRCPTRKTLRSEISRNLVPKTETLNGESNENPLPNTKNPKE